MIWGKGSASRRVPRHSVRLLKNELHCWKGHSIAFHMVKSLDIRSERLGFYVHEHKGTLQLTVHCLLQPLHLFWQVSLGFALLQSELQFHCKGINENRVSFEPLILILWQFKEMVYEPFVEIISAKYWSCSRRCKRQLSSMLITKTHLIGKHIHFSLFLCKNNWGPRPFEGVMT